jgi:hypothetical protein
MKWMLLGALTALTVTAAPGAEVNINSANYMLPNCRDFVNNKSPSGNLTGQGACAGTIDTLVFMGTILKISLEPDGWLAESVRRGLAEDIRQSMCLDIPRGVTGGQLIRVVIAYIDARPARMHEPFKGLALEALLKAWPCK